MILTTPLRFTTLHCLHRLFTEARTFTILLQTYLYRYVTLPRLRSYGDSSTRTVSPGRILIKCRLILPEM